MSIDFCWRWIHCRRLLLHLLNLWTGLLLRDTIHISLFHTRIILWLLGIFCRNFYFHSCWGCMMRLGEWRTLDCLLWWLIWLLLLRVLLLLILRLEVAAHGLHILRILDHWLVHNFLWGHNWNSYSHASSYNWFHIYVRSFLLGVVLVVVVHIILRLLHLLSIGGNKG